jgi:hypothetical protein
MTFFTNLLSDPLIRFMLTIGVVSVAYAWIWMPIVQTGIGGLWKKLVKKGNLGTFLTATIGHGLLVWASLAAVAVAFGQGEDIMILTILAAVFFWMATIGDLFEQHATTAAQETTHRFIVGLRFTMLILWIAVIVWTITMQVTLLEAPITRVSEIFLMAWTLPYYVVVLIGLLGVYGLFRSIFKALFATAGVIGLVVHPGPPEVKL